MATSKAPKSPAADTSKTASKRGSKAATVANAQEIFDQFFSNTNDGEELSGTLLLADISHVLPRERQPRTHFDSEALTELSHDIQELSARGGGVGGTGILQPLLVNQEGDGTFRIVAGERRYRAAQQAGLKTVPVIVRETPLVTGDQDEWWEDALRENIQRQDLTPMEEALALAALAQEHGYSVRVLAERLGKGKGYVEHRLALAKARADVQDLVSRRRDTLSIAREIDKVENPTVRSQLIEKALAGAPVTQLREFIDRAVGQGNPEPKTKSKRTTQQTYEWDKHIGKLGKVDSLTLAAKALKHSLQSADSLSSADQQQVEAAISSLKSALEELTAWSKNGQK